MYIQCRDICRLSFFLSSTASASQQFRGFSPLHRVSLLLSRLHLNKIFAAASIVLCMHISGSYRFSTGTWAINAELWSQSTTAANSRQDLNPNRAGQFRASVNPVLNGRLLGKVMVGKVPNSVTDADIEALLRKCPFRLIVISNLLSKNTSFGGSVDPVRRRGQLEYTTADNVVRSTDSQEPSTKDSTMYWWCLFDSRQLYIFSKVRPFRYDTNMGFIRTVALVILGISGLTFIALFGRLPAFRYAANFTFGISVVDYSCLCIGGRPSLFFIDSSGSTSLMVSRIVTICYLVDGCWIVAIIPAFISGMRTTRWSWSVFQRE